MILSYAIWIPIVFGLIILIYGSERPLAGIRYLALFGAVFGFIATLPLISNFDLANPGMQFVEKISWIPRYDINYYLGVDGISVWFVVLTAFINIFVVIAAWEVITEKVSQYYAAFMILSGLMIGVFSALDGLLFYIFFEATLIPMYIIIGVWGGQNRIYAAFKFFLYTLLGSLLALIALLYLYNLSNTFDILAWHHTKLDIVEQVLLFIAFFMAFAVKVPMIECILCKEDGGQLVWRGDDARVVLIDDPDLPGYCRVIWNRHVAEMSDLSRVEREILMALVDVTEFAVRRVMHPQKINIASLGNQVPHLHWHVIPRFIDDPFFSGSIWSSKQRELSESIRKTRRESSRSLPDAIRSGIADLA
jgi:diadenosine tetraphosphate (Ap4A) HIT family hydrolase